MAGKTFLERFEHSLNPANDGSQGKLRGEPEFNVLGVNTDREAIAQYLSQFANSPATQRTYSKEAERFHMWAVLVRNKSITDLVIEDYQAYIEFLKYPDPKWISMKKVPKSSPEWRPFTYVTPNVPDRSSVIPDARGSKGLSPEAVKLARNSVGAMLNWFVKSGYLRMNVLAILNKQDKENGETKAYVSDKVERYLDNEMWDAATRQVDKMPRNNNNEILIYERVRFLLSMFSMVGARVSEASSSVMVDFRWREYTWFWEVVGKGSISAKVAMPPDMVAALVRWRTALGIPEYPESPDDDHRPVLPAFNRFGNPIYTKTVVKNGQRVTKPRHGLSPRRINEILKAIFEAASLDPLLADYKRRDMRKASAHWLRHTSITQKIKSGMDRKHVQDDARHKDMKTTDRYSHDQDEARAADAKKHRLRWVEDV